MFLIRDINVSQPKAGGKKVARFSSTIEEYFVEVQLISHILLNSVPTSKNKSETSRYALSLLPNNSKHFRHSICQIKYESKTLILKTLHNFLKHESLSLFTAVTHIRVHTFLFPYSNSRIPQQVQRIFVVLLARTHAFL